MPALLAPILLLLLGIIAALFWTIWGIPIAILAIAVIVVVTIRARQKDPTVATWETGKGIEPTGTTRPARGGPETSNERIGQS
jgi:heme/copper-type cytochrome/quinol oxidase subunit 2